MPANQSEPTHLYYVHSPICIHLSRQHALRHGDKSVTISARCSPLRQDQIHLEDDQLASRQSLLNFAHAVGQLLESLAAGGPLRLYLPHTGSAIFRLLLRSRLVQEVWLLEEGSMYYTEDVSSRVFGPFDYTRHYDLSGDDLDLVGSSLRINRINVEEALTGNFPLFENWGGKIRGAILTHPSSLQWLGWQKELTIEILPLQRVAIPSPTQSAVMVFLPSHTNAHRQTPQAEQALVHEQKLVLHALARRFQAVVVSIHPSDSNRTPHLHEYYRTIKRVKFAEEALDPAPGFEGPGLHELSCVVFPAYLTNGSSADIYVRRLHGEGRTIDHRIFSWVLQDIEQELQIQLDTVRAEWDGLKTRLVEQQRANSEKDATIAELVASRSWRLTAPLRRIGLWTRHLRRMFK